MITLTLCTLCYVLWPYTLTGNKRPEGSPLVYWCRNNLKRRRK